MACLVTSAATRLVDWYGPYILNEFILRQIAISIIAKKSVINTILRKW